MKFFSTAGKVSGVSFEDAMLLGQAPDGGLFMPEEVPRIGSSLLAKWRGRPFSDVASLLAERWVGREIQGRVLYRLTREALNFKVPMRQVTDRIHVLELFHGPTCSFKDFGARWMARVMDYFLQRRNLKATVLVATSGDTGSAVAHAFHGLENISVIVLFPHKRVSPIQELQITSLRGNVTPVAIKGVFDDCQRLVKQAFADPDLHLLNLSSANSISIGRLLPQSFYYVYSALNLFDKGILFSVPSGNFGNLTGGLLANRMGIPVRCFIAATNVNDSVPRYLRNGTFKPRSTIATLSNAMDVGNPSNFARILSLNKNSHREITSRIVGYRVTDEQTLATIRNVYRSNGYLLDPHGAVGWSALMRHLRKNPGQKAESVLLETAHPAKFPEVIKRGIGIEPLQPKSLRNLTRNRKNVQHLPADYRNFKTWMRDTRPL